MVFRRSLSPYDEMMQLMLYVSRLGSQNCEYEPSQASGSRYSNQ
jgi:hypothetical protein